jgi:hypothetical protein
MKTIPHFINLVQNVAGTEVLEVDFFVKGFIINNRSNAVFSIYAGEKSLGIGEMREDFKVGAYDFAKLPILDNVTKITIAWTAPTEDFGYIRIDLTDEPTQLQVTANPPSTIGTGLASNVAIISALPAGTNTIGKVNIGTSDVDLARNGTSISGESLSSGGSNVLGWLSEIAKRIKTVLTVTITGALPAGSNEIGKVVVTEMPPVTVTTTPVRTSHEHYRITVGDVVTTIDFLANDINQIIFIHNKGTSSVFLTFDNDVVTAASSNGRNGVIEIEAGEVLNDITRNCKKLNLIRPSGQSGLVRFMGV